MTTTLTQQRLKELLEYDPETGVFVWKKKSGRRGAALAPIGSVAGSDDGNGYIRIGIDYKDYRGHRLAWLYVHGEYPTKQIDHVDGNRANNAISNLRLATQSENNQNQREARGARNGMPLGVYRSSKNRWKALIGIGGKKIQLGHFDTQAKALDAYLKAKKELHPFQTIVGAERGSDAMD